ncbi:peptidoglycan amidohydrolase family protein [Enterococcus sp. AZ072]|uniref:peptidoglycan amidohydrolase family protein n=1 Tax=unclassified Enterococcus TaxID=2608891 RepID=UPI003D270C3F
MEKKRFKMYKKGKQWLVAPIVFIGLLSAVGMATGGTTAYADEAPASPSSEYIQVETPQADVTPVKPDESAVLPEDNQSNITPPATDPGENNQTEEPVVDPFEDPSTEVKDPAVDPGEDTSAEDKDPAPTEEDSSTETENPVEETEEQPKTDPVDSTEANKPTETTTDKNTVTEAAVPDKNKETAPKAPAQPVKAQAKAAAAPASAKAAEQATIQIYRVYNPNSGEHLHTMNANERNFLVNLGWRYEGVSMLVTPTGHQLHRIYNPNSGEHHYTLNMNEINMLKRAGWRYEGIAWHTPATGVSIYRVYNPNTRGAGAHHYTMDANERDTLIRSGWRNEGISWFSAGTKQPQEILMDWFYARQGQVTYSMTNRNGPNSYDCSSAVFYALMEATYLPMGTWVGNTDSLFALENKILMPISRDQVRRGDIFIAGKKGNSAGAFGHTGVATSNSRIIHCNYKDNGISETLIAGRTGDPCYWYRLVKR